MIPLIFACLLWSPSAAQEPLRPLMPPSGPSAEVPADLVETAPALRIDGQEVQWGEFARWLVRFTGESRAREFALETYVIEREALRRQVELQPAAVGAEIDALLTERIEKTFAGRKEEWLAELQRTGRTEFGVRSEFSNRLRPELLSKGLAAIDRVVPEHQIVREWELLHGRHGKRFDLRGIFVRVVVPTPDQLDRAKFLAATEQAKAEGLNRAQKLRERLLQGEDFEALAARESEDAPTKARRGQWAGGFRHPGWPWNFLDALEALRVGEISQPLYAKGGYWLLKVLKVDETPLEKVRRELEVRLLARGPQADEIGAVQERLRENVSVEVLPTLWGERSSPERPDLAEPVITVDGEPVSRAVFARWMSQRIGESLAHTFAESYLVHKRAEELGVSATLEEAEQRARDYIDELVRDSKGGSREAWLEYQSRGGRDPKTLYREWTFRSQTDVLAEKMIIAERKVSPESVRFRYEELYGKTGERLEARVIALPILLENVEEGWSREELEAQLALAADKARARALELLARLREGEDFAELARKESADANTRALGGRVAGRFREDRYTPEIYAAAQTAKVGEPIGPFRQANAWYLVEVIERRKVALDEVSAEIAEELRTRRPSLPELMTWRNSLRQKSKLEILPGLGQ